MVLIDTNSLLSNVSPIKSNYKENNILSLPENKGHNYVVNSFGIKKSEASKYQAGYLFIRYSYVDKIDNIRLEPKLEIFKCTSIAKPNGQYGRNVDIELREKAKIFLALKHKKHFNSIFRK